MQTKYFNSQLVPMELPVYEGLESLSMVDNSLFPLYARPHVEGVDIMIRHGFIHFVGKSLHPFRNISIKEKFKGLLEFSRINKFSIHATFKSNSVDAFNLKSLLASHDVCTYEESIASEDGLELYSYREVLPEDLKLVVTDVIIDCYAEKMNISSRKANLWFINREMSNDSLIVQVPEYCVDNEHLDMLLNEYRGSEEFLDGVALYGDGTVYVPGNSYRSTGAVIIKLVEETTLEILKVTSDVRYIMEDSPLRGRFVVLDVAKDSVQELQMGLLSQVAKKIVSSSMLLGLQPTTMTVKRLNLRTLEVPEVKSIKFVNYAA